MAPMPSRSHCRSLFSTLVSAVSLLLVGCGQAAPDAPLTESEQLVGGRPATDLEFPSAIAVLWPGTTRIMCTAAKVGARHILLAAHCVHDRAANAMLAEFRPGAA